jgi:hypothetical protein
MSQSCRRVMSDNWLPRHHKKLSSSISASAGAGRNTLDMDGDVVAEANHPNAVKFRHPMAPGL